MPFSEKAVSDFEPFVGRGRRAQVSRRQLFNEDFAHFVADVARCAYADTKVDGERVERVACAEKAQADNEPLLRTEGLTRRALLKPKQFGLSDPKIGLNKAGRMRNFQCFIPVLDDVH